LGLSIAVTRDVPWAVATKVPVVVLPDEPDLRSSTA
jgi:hypothetical protein